MVVVRRVRLNLRDGHASHACATLHAFLKPAGT